jgi:hypothetical protein
MRPSRRPVKLTKGDLMRKRPSLHAAASRFGASSSEVDPLPTSDDIAKRAHAIWIAHGRLTSRIEVYWRAAESELVDEAARRLLAAIDDPSVRTCR